MRPEDFRRAIERTLELAARAFTRPYYAGDRRRTALPGRAEEAVRPLEGDRDRRCLEHRHLPPHLARPRLPVRARAPLCVRGAGRNASASARAPYPPPARTRSPRSIRSAASGSSATRRFREWSPAAQPRRIPGRHRRARNGSPDANVSAVLRGSADLAAGCDQSAVAGRARVRADTASQASSRSTRGTAPTSSSSTRAFRHSTTSGCARR